jgi:hypothetical protein
VLVTRKSALASGHVFPDFEPSCVRCLNKIIEKSGAKIVISSTWRHAHPKHLNLIEFLKEQGVKGEVVGMTRIGDSAHRGIKIHAWLEDWKEGVLPSSFNTSIMNKKIKSYVILDDDNVRPLDRLVRTTFEYGLEEIHVAEALRILENVL